MAKREYKKATKEEIVQIIKLWPTHSSNEIAAVLGRPAYFVHDKVVMIRAKRPELVPKKARSVKAHTESLINEVLAEMKN